MRLQRAGERRERESGRERRERERQRGGPDEIYFERFAVRRCYEGKIW